jgi:Skp family chaperone for outer membrane proteins
MNRSTLAALAVGAAISAAAFLAGSADARRATAPVAPPTAVGVVNLRKVFDVLPQSAEWDVKIKGLESAFAEEARTRKGELDGMVKAIEAMAEGKERETKLDEARLKRLQLEQWAGFKELEIDRERSLKWQAVYKLVRDAARQLAADEGYDLVLVDDSGVEIRTQRAQNAPSLEAQAQSQISQIRVLFSGGAADVTQKILVQIKNSEQKSPTTTSNPTATPTPSKPAAATPR